VKIVNVQQGSDAWLRVRMGIPTASQFDRILTSKTRKPSASQAKYLCELLAERVLGQPIDNATTEFMHRGSMLEERAVGYYEFTTGLATESVGFITDDDGRWGCSPDRLVGERGMLEVKCLAAQNHMGALLGMFDDEYVSQCQGQLWVAGRDWVDNLFWSPSMPARIVRFHRDDEHIDTLSEAVRSFCDRLDEAHRRLVREYPEIIVPNASAVSAYGSAPGTEARTA
jgi:hypothetical protein